MTRQDLERQVMMAARDQGVSSVLFRNAIGRKLGLSVTDNECLSYLAIKGEATPSELARYTGLTTGSATAMLDRLEKAVKEIKDWINGWKDKVRAPIHLTQLANFQNMIIE